MKRIWALVRKDFVFNWQVSIGSIFFLVAWMVALWIDAQMEGVLDIDGFLFAMAIAGFGFMPMNYSCRKEQGVSTKQFLESLPIKYNEICVSKIIVATIYTVFLAVILGGLSYLFQFSLSFHYVVFGTAFSICFSSLYIFINYAKNYQSAQILFLGIFMLWFGLDKYKGEHISQSTFFLDTYILAGIVTILLSVSVYVIVKLSKEKRRL